LYSTPDELNAMNFGASLDSQKLTPREREVLTWAAAGKSAWETATILSISQKTVTHHLDHIRRKLGVANTTQAVVAALRAGELKIF
jgi:LuxR family transcriptional regulator, quorum-sensing system regulator BjaR1